MHLFQVNVVIVYVEGTNIKKYVVSTPEDVKKVTVTLKSKSYQPKETPRTDEVFKVINQIIFDFKPEIQRRILILIGGFTIPTEPKRIESTDEVIEHIHSMMVKVIYVPINKKPEQITEFNKHLKPKQTVTTVDINPIIWFITFFDSEWSSVIFIICYARASSQFEFPTFDADPTCEFIWLISANM